MKKNSLLSFLFVIAMMLLMFSCHKEDKLKSEKLSFQNLREISATSTDVSLSDDTLNKTSSLVFNEEVIFFSTWQHGMYSGPLIPTRLLWSENQGYRFFLIGKNDLTYDKLLVIYPDDRQEFFDVAIIELISAELVQRDDTVDHIHFLYNNSWVRTGPIADQEKNIKL